METIANQLMPIKGPKVKRPQVRKLPPVVKFLRFYFNTLGKVLPTIAANHALKLFSKPRSRYFTKSYDHLLADSNEFTVRDGYFEIRGRIWDNTGPTVLLVHGWESSGLHLGSFVEPLWTEGFKVILFDGPAHGTSSGTHSNLMEFAEAIRLVIKEMGPIDHLVAHSFGGPASIYLAAEYRDELILDKMVLISVPNKLTDVLEDFRSFLKIPYRVQQKMVQIIKNRYNVDPAEIESARLGKQMNVGQILVIHDKNDDTLPFHNALEIVHSLPNAVLLKTENLGHNRLLKNPQVISTILQFLISP